LWVTHAGNIIDVVCQQISLRGVVGTGRNFAGSWRGVDKLHHPDIWHRGSPSGAKILKVLKKFVTHFSKVVSPISMKIGRMEGFRGEQVLSNFGEFWSTFSGA